MNLQRMLTRTIDLNVFESWIEKFHPFGDTNAATEVRRAFFDFLKLLEFDDSTWCSTRNSQPADFWVYAISKYPIDPLLGNLILEILSIPFGSADAER